MKMHPNCVTEWDTYTGPFQFKMFDSQAVYHIKDEINYLVESRSVVIINSYSIE